MLLIASESYKSQVVDQRTSEQKPLLAPIVADPVSNISSFLVSFHLSSGSGEEEKNGAEKWGGKNGVENGLGSRGRYSTAGVDALKIKLFLKNELFKLFNNSQNKIDSRDCFREN